LTTFIDHRRRISDDSCPTTNDLGRIGTFGNLQRACRNGCQPPSELSGSYRFDQPITDHNRQKRCSTISARSSSPLGLTLRACGFQTEDIQNMGRYRGGLFCK